MKVLRVILAIVFFLLVVAGLWRYFMSDVGATPSLPLVTKITNFADKFVANKKKGASKNDVKNVGNRGEEKKDKDMLGGDEDLLHQEFTVGSLPAGAFSKLIERGYLAGKSSAELLVLQYCDYSAIYCQQASKDGLLDAYLQEFPNQLQTLTKQFPKSMDDRGTLSHRAALCAYDRGTTQQYVAFEKLLFQQPNANINILLNLAEGLGIDDLGECLDETNATLYLLQETKQAKDLFEISVLPTYIVLSKETGTWVKIPGLYTNDEMFSAVEYLLAQ